MKKLFLATLMLITMLSLSAATDALANDRDVVASTTADGVTIGYDAEQRITPEFPEGTVDGDRCTPKLPEDISGVDDASEVGSVNLSSDEVSELWIVANDSVTLRAMLRFGQRVTAHDGATYYESPDLGGSGRSGTANNIPKICGSQVLPGWSMVIWSRPSATSVRMYPWVAKLPSLCITIRRILKSCGLRPTLKVLQLEEWDGSPLGTCRLQALSQVIFPRRRRSLPLKSSWVWAQSLPITILHSCRKSRTTMVETRPMTTGMSLRRVSACIMRASKESICSRVQPSWWIDMPSSPTTLSELAYRNAISIVDSNRCV